MGSGEKRMQCESSNIEPFSEEQEEEERSGKEHITASLDAFVSPFSLYDSFLEHSHEDGPLEIGQECKEIVLLVGDEEGNEEGEQTSSMDDHTPLTASFSSPSSSLLRAANDVLPPALHKGVERVIWGADKSAEEPSKGEIPPPVTPPYPFSRKKESVVFMDVASTNVLSSTSSLLSSSPPSFLSFPLSRALFPPSASTPPPTSAITTATTTLSPTSSSHHHVPISSTFFSTTRIAERHHDPWKGESEDRHGGATPCGVPSLPRGASVAPLPECVPCSTSSPSPSVSCAVVPAVCARRSSLRYGWCGGHTHFTAHRSSPPSPSPSPFRRRGKESERMPSLRLSPRIPPWSSFRSPGIPEMRSTPPSPHSTVGGEGRERCSGVCNAMPPANTAQKEDHPPAPHRTAAKMETEDVGRQTHGRAVPLSPPSFHSSLVERKNECDSACPSSAAVPSSPRIPHRTAGGAWTRCLGKIHPPSSPRSASTSPAFSKMGAATRTAPLHARTACRGAKKEEENVCEGLAQVEMTPGRVILIPLFQGDHLPSLAAAFLHEHGLSPTLQRVIEQFLVAQRRRWRRQCDGAAKVVACPTFVSGHDERTKAMGTYRESASVCRACISKAQDPVDEGEERVVRPNREGKDASVHRGESRVQECHTRALPHIIATALLSPSVEMMTREREGRRPAKTKTPRPSAPPQRPTRTTVLRQQYWRQQLEQEPEQHAPDAPTRIPFFSRPSRETHHRCPLFSVDPTRLSRTASPEVNTKERSGAEGVRPLSFSSRMLSLEENAEKRVEVTASCSPWEVNALGPSDTTTSLPIERAGFSIPIAWPSCPTLSGTETARGEEKKEIPKRKPVVPQLSKGSGLPKDIRTSEERELQEKCTFHPKINRDRGGHGRIGRSPVARQEDGSGTADDTPSWTQKEQKKEGKEKRTPPHSHCSPPRENTAPQRAWWYPTGRERRLNTTTQDSSSLESEDRWCTLPLAPSERTDHPPRSAAPRSTPISPAFPNSYAFALSSSCATQEGVQNNGKDVPSPFSVCCSTRFPRPVSAVPPTHSPSVGRTSQEPITGIRSTPTLPLRKSDHRSIEKENDVHFKAVEDKVIRDGTYATVNAALPLRSVWASSSARDGKERNSGAPALTSTVAASSSSPSAFSSAGKNPIVSAASPTLVSVAEIQEKLASLSHQWKKRGDVCGLTGSE